MTALAGLWNLGQEADPRRPVQRMLQAQRVYAEDPGLIQSDGAVAIGRRLFRTLPEDVHDRGPVTLVDGGLLIADVRLDNREDLSSELGMSSQDAQTFSDTSIVARSIERWGEGAILRLIGDFALVWWDPSQQRIVLARDFVGNRPLHYHRREGFFACASMPKGLHALPDVPRAANSRSAAGFLAHIPEGGDDSYFAGISKVPPGHFAVVTRKTTSIHRYWDPEPAPLLLKGADAYAEALRAELDRAVASRLRGTGPQVAAHLSGGLDSSAVTATAARLVESHQRIIAYTSVPRDGFVSARRGLIDEGPLAAAVAELYSNIEHVRISTGAVSPFEALDRHAFLYERPYLNLCNGVWIDAINDDAKQRGIRVLMTGAMGNAGFSYDGMQRLPELLARGHLPALAQEAGKLVGRGMRLGTVAAATIGPFLPRALWRGLSRLRGRTHELPGYSMIGQAATRDLQLAAMAAARDVDFSYRPRRHARETQLWLLGRADFGNYYKGTLGGWGIDIRDATADRRLIELCLAIPAEQYLADGYSRVLARRALSDRLPAAVTQETRKGYQGADWFEGLDAGRSELATEIERMARDPASAALLDLARLRHLHAAWPAGSWEQEKTVETYRLALLRGVSMGHFMRKASGTN